MHLNDLDLDRASDHDIDVSRRASAGQNGFLLAIDFGGTKIAMATVTETGRRLHEAEIPTLAQQGAQTVMRRMFEAAHALIATTAADVDGALLALAAVTPGIVEPDGVRLAPNNPGWDRLALHEVLREGFAVQCVSVETDVKAAALAEARCGALAGIDCGLYVNLGTGLAAAAVVDGRVLRGAHGAAGEIGYQLRGVPGEIPFADGGAPLEDFVSGRAIAERVSALLGRHVTTREAFALRASTPPVNALLDDALHALRVQIVNLTLMLDPSRIVIGGGMARVAGIPDGIRALLERAVPYPPEVMVAAFGHGAALQGAIVAAGDAWRARRVAPGHSSLRQVEPAHPGT